MNCLKKIKTPIFLHRKHNQEVKIADVDEREVVVVLRACDLNAVRRLDAMYLENGVGAAGREAGAADQHRRRAG